MKYVPGPAFGQFSGSQGNTVASHNRFGSYLRNRTIPVNPNTPSQTSARNAFTDFSQTWRILTPSQQLGWTQLADIDPIIDTQGQSIVLTGIAYYVRFNMNRRSVGEARLATAPALVEAPPTIASAVLTLSGGAAAMDYTPTVTDGTPTNFQLIMATQQLSAGISFVGRSDFRVLGFIAGDAPAVPPEDIVPIYEAVHGEAWRTSVGMQIAYRFTGISDSGFIGDFLQQFATIDP